MVCIIDLDGVIWRSERPIPGSAEAVGRLREAGERVLFVSNNSRPLLQETLDKLNDAGVPAEPDDLITSAQAAASMLEPGTTALVCGGPGVKEALEARGIETVHEGHADAVVVGFHREFDYDRLTAAFQAVLDGARLIGTNDDATFPTPDGLVPGGGALLAAVATAAGVEPEVAGKPHRPMADLIRERVGSETLEGWLIGDRPSTDGLMAKRLDMPFVLAMSGITGEDDLPAEPEPVRIVPDLDSFVGPDGHASLEDDD